MIAAIIFAISLMTLLQFFVSYSRSLIAESQNHQLSECAKEVARVTGRNISADQFDRLLQLLALCPGSGNDTLQVRTVSAYFKMLSLGRVCLSWAFPAAASWIEAERGGCTYAAAVVLDRRIAYNRMLTARQMSRV